MLCSCDLIMLKDPYDERQFTHGLDWNLNRSRQQCNKKLEHSIINYIEGWGAAVAVGVSVAATAASAYASSSAKDDAAGIAPPTLHSYKPVLATQNQYAGIQGLQGAYQQYGGAANQIAQGENNFYRQSINAIAPGTTQGIYLAGKNANQELRGEIPADVQASIQRASAQNALTGGFGADSGVGRNLTSRDLGLTSLNLTQMGAQGLTNNTRLAQSLTPFSAGDILGTSQQYQQNFDNYNLRNADTQNQAAKDAAGIQNQNAQNSYQQEVNQALAPNPYLAAGLAAASSASSAYLGYAGRAGSSQPNSYGFYNTPQSAYGAYGPGAQLGYTPGGGYYAQGNNGYG